MITRGLILGGLAAVALASPPAVGAAPKVRQLVVFRDGQALQRMTGTATTTVTVRGRRCGVGGGTALAALVRSRPGQLSLRDFGSCSTNPRDSAGLFVTEIRSDRNRGQRGWVYKVGHRAASAGAGDTGGPFGSGRLRAGQRVTWFYCLRAADCQRTLGLTASVFRGGVAAEVRGYDDAGDGIPIAGATVTASGVSGVTDAEGRVQLELHPGFQRLVARKDGLVRSFTKLVEVP